jgi:hypothetical protein
MVHNRLYLALYYLVAPSPLVLRGEVVVCGTTGVVLARFELPSNGTSCLRQAVKVGDTGIVAHAAFHDNGVEVTTWDPAL